MLKRLLRNASADAARRDLERYLKVMEGASDPEVAELVIAGQSVRLSAQADGLPPAVFLAPMLLEPGHALTVIEGLTAARSAADRSRDDARVAGITVWLHSLRCAVFPENRSLGRQLWGQLARGIPEARHLAERLRPLGIMDPFDEVSIIPSGLEPRDASGREVMPGLPGLEALVVYARVKEQEDMSRQEAERVRQAASDAARFKALPVTLGSLDHRIRAAQARNGVSAAGGT